MMHRVWRWAAGLSFLACLAPGGRPLDPAAAQAARALAPLGPLGHWKGEDGDPAAAAADASGNGFHGTYSAGATRSAEVPATKFQNAGSIQLDGATGVVSVPDAPALRLTGDFTVAFWKRRTANVNDWSRLVGKGNSTQRNFGIWEFPQGDGRIKFQMYSAGGQSVLEVDSPTPTTLNAWHHIVCTVSVNAAALYLDGKLAANGTRNGDPGTSADPLTFGHAGFHAFWPGQLDDIRIYDRALSMGEIVYLAGGQGAPAGPTGLAAEAGGAREVRLRWAAPATPAPAGTATCYAVKRSTTPGSGYVTVASGLIAPAHVDAAAAAGTTRYYVVTAYHCGGESVASNEVAVAVPAK